MAMRFHQRRFFAYPGGAPSLRTLSAVSSYSHVLVTTDRSVALLGHGDAGYSLRKLEVDALHSGKADVVTSAVIERPDRPARVALVYGVGEALFLQLVTPLHDAAERLEASSAAKFDLDAAPTSFFSVKSKGQGGDVFYGVIACCADSMRAFGFIENDKQDARRRTGSTNSEVTASPFVRLDNEQFAAFFPEFAAFRRQILAVDIVTRPASGQGWIAFGCADGLVRVFHGAAFEGCLGGPYKTKDLQLNGPITSVSLFPTRGITTKDDSTAAWRCNLLVTCAIGQAVVYEDLLNPANDGDCGEVLADSDSFDSIFAGVAADIDLDGEVELLLGTDSQVMLAYKEKQEAEADSEPKASRDAIKSEVDDAPTSDSASPMSAPSSLNIWHDDELPAGVETADPDSSSQRRRWQRLPRSLWDMETFGAIYSLLWRDVNHDGAPELLVASSTGIYVYEADPASVLLKLERVLAAIAQQ